MVTYNKGFDFEKGTNTLVSSIKTYFRNSTLWYKKNVRPIKPVD